MSPRNLARVSKGSDDRSRYSDISNTATGASTSSEQELGRFKSDIDQHIGKAGNSRMPKLAA